jgi:hypothetical protein
MSCKARTSFCCAKDLIEMAQETLPGFPAHTLPSRKRGCAKDLIKMAQETLPGFHLRAKSRLRRLRFETPCGVPRTPFLPENGAAQKI